jgi:hypothetical protein
VSDIESFKPENGEFALLLFSEGFHYKLDFHKPSLELKKSLYFEIQTLLFSFIRDLRAIGNGAREDLHYSTI